MKASPTTVKASPATIEPVDPLRLLRPLRPKTAAAKTTPSPLKAKEKLVVRKVQVKKVKKRKSSPERDSVSVGFSVRIDL